MIKSFDNHFWGESNPEELVHKYGTPLYVYNEEVLRKCCREMKSLLPESWFGVNYSIKANSNLSLLKVIRDEGLDADAVSPGEIYLLLKAGFKPSQILFIGNNVAASEMEYAVDNGITVSVDSLSQLETYGQINPGGKVSVRFNPGIGSGHHQKVITGGDNTKFGINANLVTEVKKIAGTYSLQITGVNQHIGSLFLSKKPYIEGVKALLEIASEFSDLEFIDFGGGFGIPYHKLRNDKRLDLKGLTDLIHPLLIDWQKCYDREVKIKIEPGRYIVAESGRLLGRVHSIKQNGLTKYIGTDLGFNVLMRPVLYDSYHEIIAFRDGLLINDENQEIATVVGNICETGDILAKNRKLPSLKEGDLLAVLDTGAYGYSMSSNYNLRLKPAEVLITADGTDKLIRKRDTLEGLMENFL